MTVQPAYGRDYKNSKEVQADWDANKDFIVADLFSGEDGRYINKEDAKGPIYVRYCRDRKIAHVQ